MWCGSRDKDRVLLLTTALRMAYLQLTAFVSFTEDLENFFSTVIHNLSVLLYYLCFSISPAPEHQCILTYARITSDKLPTHANLNQFQSYGS